MRKLLSYLKPYRMLIVFIVGLLFIQALTDLYMPNLMADIIDVGVINSDIPYIWKVGGFMLIVAAVGTVCSVAASYFAAKVSMSYGKDLRSKVFSHVQRFSLQEFDKVGTASLITRTTNDITQVQTV